MEVPTLPEMIRIKSVLIMKRNAMRDFMDFAALSDLAGKEAAVEAMARIDALYPQDNGASAYQQIILQLADPKPYDLDKEDVGTYKNVVPEWSRWGAIKNQCMDIAVALINGPQAEDFDI